MNNTTQDSKIFEINESEKNYFHQPVFHQYAAEIASHSLKKPDSAEMVSMGSIGADMMPIPFGNRKKMARMLDIPKKHKEELLDERQRLVEKKFNGGGISESEEKRLALIRWKLDRIDEAEYGDDLDRLEMFVASQEKLSEDFNLFLRQYGKSSRRQRKRK